MRGLLGLAAAAALATGLAAGEFEAAQPDAALSPEEVVRIQVGALGENDDPGPDSGVEVSFRFVSPAIRSGRGIRAGVSIRPGRF